MPWMNQYKPKVVSAEKAIRAITNDDRVFLTGNCSVPQTLLAALVDYAPNLNNVEVTQVLALAGDDYAAPEMTPHLRINTLFISDNVRKAVNEGRADFTPAFLGEIPRLFYKWAFAFRCSLDSSKPTG